jgi:hypothetical protein
MASVTNLSRRAFLATGTAAGLARLPIVRGTLARAAVVYTDFSKLPVYGNGTLSAGIRSRQIVNVNGMTVHILEAGYETRVGWQSCSCMASAELAYSWRKVVPSLAAAGYHVIAPDRRAYGRTTGWDDSYDADPDLHVENEALAAIYRTQLATDLVHDTKSAARSSAKDNSILGGDFMDILKATEESPA